ncbi:hypothetical protein SUNI508_05947 [Seiridium unicorne]|uniref:Uncharacterized protein n=1 Tax=Seiridium unicorne TaxID=138068 RepID=A0ABR2V2F2_9PEZI
MLKTPTSGTGHPNIYAWFTSFPLRDSGRASRPTTDHHKINLRFFEHGEEDDPQEILDAVKVIRPAFHAAPAPLTPLNKLHPCPDKNQNCTDAQIKETLKFQAHRHHATI